MEQLIRKINKNIDDFCDKITKQLNPKCIILYGSLARGDFNERSDIDMIIISDNLPENYFERAKLIHDFIEFGVPIEPLGYTSDEFINMIKKRHCTSLFALEEGKPLCGKEYFSYLKKIHDKMMKKYKIVKEEAAWIPKALLKQNKKKI